MPVRQVRDVQATAVVAIGGGWCDGRAWVFLYVVTIDHQVVDLGHRDETGVKQLTIEPTSAKPEDGGPSLRRSLSFINLFIFGLVCMAPVAAFTMYGFVSVTSDGATILSYLLGAAGILLTALSFAQMAAVAAQSGSVYGYAKFAVGWRVGFLGGWAMLLDYLLLGALTAVYGALYIANGLPQVPEWAFLGAVFTLLLSSGIKGVSLSSKFDFMVLLAQLAFSVLFVILASLMIYQAVDVAPAFDLFPDASSTYAVLGGASLTVISFLGFDAISTLAEEVSGQRPGRDIGLATVLSVIIMLIIFIVVSWLLDRLAIGLVLPDPAIAAFDILAQRMPALATPLALICGLAIGIGGTQACHTGSTRLVFAMARDRQLPAVLGRINRVTRTPISAALLTFAIIATISTVALDQAELLANLVSFGALSGFFLVNFSVINHFGIRQRSRSWIRHWLAPLLGMAVIAYIMTGINPLALKVGLGWMALGLVIHWLHNRGDELEPRETVDENPV